MNMKDHDMIILSDAHYNKADENVQKFIDNQAIKILEISKKHGLQNKWIRLIVQ